jgi:hypothetical protein
VPSHDRSLKCSVGPLIVIVYVCHHHACGHILVTYLASRSLRAEEQSFNAFICDTNTKDITLSKSQDVARLVIRAVKLCYPFYKLLKL